MLDKRGWKYLKKAAQNIRKVYTCVHETIKNKQEPKYKPPTRNLTNATPTMVTRGRKMRINRKSTCWTLSRHDDHSEFTDDKAKGLYDKGYQYIHRTMIYDVKHNGRIQAWFVASRHMTHADGTDLYSSIVLLHTLRLAILLGELNSLSIIIRDITSAYLMAFMKEKIFFKAGPKFGAKSGHLMVVSKALYGL
jgi:hypothetical protein